MKSEMNARPHPDPLPRGEGTVACACNKFVRRSCNRRASAIRSTTHNNLTTAEHTGDCQMFIPLLGERAGVRAVVNFFQTNFQRFL